MLEYKYIKDHTSGRVYEMYKFFIYLCSTVLTIGLVLFGLSFITEISHWIGIEMVKGSVYLFIFGIFMQLIESNTTVTREQV